MNEWMPGGVSYVQQRRAQGFWRRQFDDAPTRAQGWFDVIFGVVMPVFCFYFDPVVFRGGFVNDDGLYAAARFYAYTISALEMVALCAWLSAAGRGGRGPAALAGVLFAGAMFAFVVGVAILPWSAVGLIVLIGALGFVPFLTALVYMRNAWRAANAAGRAGPGLQGWAAAAFGCGFLFALAVPTVVRLLD